MNLDRLLRVSVRSKPTLGDCAVREAFREAEGWGYVVRVIIGDPQQSLAKKCEMFALFPYWVNSTE